MPKPLPIVVLISGSGTNLQEIINQCHNINIVHINGVISDKENAYGLERAKKAGIHTRVLTERIGETREEYCHVLGNIVEKYSPKLVILAGFMKYLTPNFVNRFENQIINIHPSLLPKHPGLNTHQRVIDNGDETHGITIHMVNEELDGGPILLQKEFNVIKLMDTAESLEHMVHKIEHRWYPETINLLAKWMTRGDK